LRTHFIIYYYYYYYYYVPQAQYLDLFVLSDQFLMLPVIRSVLFGSPDSRIIRTTPRPTQSGLLTDYRTPHRIYRRAGTCEQDG